MVERKLKTIPSPDPRFLDNKQKKFYNFKPFFNYKALKKKKESNHKVLLKIRSYDRIRV